MNEHMLKKGKVRIFIFYFLQWRLSSEKLSPSKKRKRRVNIDYILKMSPLPPCVGLVWVADGCACTVYSNQIPYAIMHTRMYMT